MGVKVRRIVRTDYYFGAKKPVILALNITAFKAGYELLVYKSDRQTLGKTAWQTAISISKCLGRLSLNINIKRRVEYE